VNADKSKLGILEKCRHKIIRLKV